MHTKKQIQELITDWNELEAYRQMQGESFDFGTGLILNEGKGSEDVYWKIEQHMIDDALNYLENREFKMSKRKLKTKPNKYFRRDIKNNKLKKLSKYVYTIYYNEDCQRYIQFYLSGVKSYAKWCTNRKVRNSYEVSNHGNYRKAFDYWWTVF